MMTHNYYIPAVTAIIERYHNKKLEVLIETRWKPRSDPKYTGTLELPSGKVNPNETVFQALLREVYEETGLKINNILPYNKLKIYSFNEDVSYAFVPFCCLQQKVGNKNWISFVFRCTVEKEDPNTKTAGQIDVRWIKISELKDIVKNKPEMINTFHLSVLQLYFNKLFFKK
jgi:8-oxo-dGTP pyrophosphatase MutT (NUDIX family)